MSARALALLAQLERRELDRRRLNLAGEEAVRTALEEKRSRAHATTHAAAAAFSSGELPADITARTIEGGRRLADETKRALTIQNDRCAQAQLQLAEQMSTVKRLEIVARRRADAAKKRSEYKQQRELDDITTMRHGRHDR